MAATRPTHLVGYPSVIGRLARAALAGELDCRPLRVSTNSEPLLRRGPPGDRRRMARPGPQPLGIHRDRRPGGRLWPSARDYTSARTRWCSNASMKTAPRWHPTNRRCERSRPGWPTARFPFIRYDLGDEVTLLSGPCECGSAFARVADIGGRRDDDFRYGVNHGPRHHFSPCARHRSTRLRIPSHADTHGRRHSHGRAPRCRHAYDFGGGRIAPLRRAGSDRGHPGRRPHSSQ